MWAFGCVWGAYSLAFDDGMRISMVALPFGFVGLASWLALNRGRGAIGVRTLIWGALVVVTALPLVFPGSRGLSFVGFPVAILLAGIYLRRIEVHAVVFACFVSSLSVVGINAAQGYIPEIPHHTYLGFVWSLLALLSLFILWRGAMIRGVGAVGPHDLDAVTGLPGRLDGEAIIRQLLEGSPPADSLILVQVNLDRFSHVNLANGREAGDGVLLGYAERLLAVAPDAGHVWRMDSDEFALVLPVTGDVEASIHKLVSKLQALVSDPFEIGGKGGLSVSMTTSVGLALFPNGPSDSPSNVLRRVSTALAEARQAEGGGVQVFEHAMGQHVVRRFRVESALRKAIQADELQIYVQSQVDRTGAVVGAECLVRWLHPKEGLILPGEFLPIAEESDLIVELGQWVLLHACELQVQMDQAGLTHRLSINISPRQFMKADFTSHLEETVRRTGANPRKLVLEVTEGLIIRDTADVVAKMKHLKGMGFRFSLDDFGTGYSSLSYLKNLPVQELKIARGFIQDAATNSEDAALVKAMLSVAGHLNLQVVAEGVETAAQTLFLASLGDVICQGFLYSRPQLASEWLEGQLRGRILLQTTPLAVPQIESLQLQ